MDPSMYRLIALCTINHTEVGVEHRTLLLEEHVSELRPLLMLVATINDFMMCRRANPTVSNHIVDNLPQHRVTCNRPFSILGCDNCEPITNRELKELWESVKIFEKENSFLKKKAYNGTLFRSDLHTLMDFGRLPLKPFKAFRACSW
ncbi:hypothetical protein HZH68_006064 [Vespula germanica]|uniref:Uncharacterized protein n=1 Tax=Vespula germanica TaxID=30212 RepID=A0A834KB38_VESGE|nr:hypothetical protein HZH68_006064 [Vespula germanica]